jgi:hypothetical protein
MNKGEQHEVRRNPDRSDIHNGSDVSYSERAASAHLEVLSARDVSALEREAMNQGPQFRWRVPTPGEMLKWGGVVFAYCVGAIIVCAMVLSLFGMF